MNKEKTDYSVYCISDDDFKKLLNVGCKNARDTALILLMGRLALRVGEVRQLRVRNIDFENGFVHLEKYKGWKQYKKTTEELTIPLFETCLTSLKYLCEKISDKPDVFIFHKAKDVKGKSPLSIAQLENIVAKIAKKAGVKNPIPAKQIERKDGKKYVMYSRVNSHLLRHTAIRHILKQYPGDYQLAQKMARHADIKLTIGTYGDMSLETKSKKIKEMKT